MKKIKINNVEYFIRYEAEDYYLVSKKKDGPQFKVDKPIK